MCIILENIATEERINLGVAENKIVLGRIRFQL